MTQANNFAVQSTAAGLYALAVPDCVRLAVMGGPDYPSRGMILTMETNWVVRMLAAAFDLEQLIASQETLVEFARRAYTQEALAAEEGLLTHLRALREVPRSEQRYRLLDLLLVESPANPLQASNPDQGVACEG